MHHFPKCWKRSAVMPWDNLERDNKQYIKQILENLKISEKDAQENEQLFQNWNKQRYDKVKHNRIQDCSIGESTVEKNPLSTHRKIKKKYGMFLEYFHRFRKKGLTSPTNSCDVLIRYIWGQSSIQLTWDVIMTQKQLYYLCPTIRKISLPKIFRNGQIKSKNSLMKEIHKQIKIIELKERHL